MMKWIVNYKRNGKLTLTQNNNHIEAHFDGCTWIVKGNISDTIFLERYTEKCFTIDALVEELNKKI